MLGFMLHVEIRGGLNLDWYVSVYLCCKLKLVDL